MDITDTTKVFGVREASTRNGWPDAGALRATTVKASESETDCATRAGSQMMYLNRQNSNGPIIE